MIVPIKERGAIIAAFNRWQSNRPHARQEDIETLFSAYNQYVNRYPKDRSCGSCVQFIFNFWKNTILEWPSLN